MAAARQRGAAVEDADIVQAQKASLEDVLAEAVLAIHPPGEVQHELMEGALEEIQVALAVQGLFCRVEENTGPGVHWRIHVAEVPFVRRDLSGWMHVLILQ